MNYQRNILGLLFTCCAIFCGCQRAETFADLEELESFVHRDDSPFLQTITENGLKISLRYMPTEAVMVNSYRQYLKDKERILGNSLLNKNEQVAGIEDLKNSLRRQKEANARSIYFHLTIEYEDQKKDLIYERMKSGHQAYSEWLQKLMFGLKEQITLQSPALGEILLDVYHMERSFGLQKSSNFILVFPAQFNGRDVLDPKNEWLQMRIKEFGLGTGPLTFKYQLPFKEVIYKGEL